MERESFVGTWDVHVGPSPSALLLNPDGTYLCVSWGGPRSHWGRWSLANHNGQPCLVLQLAGAQPLVEFGPYGPQPVQWSPFESLVLTGSQPDRVDFQGGVMQRRARPGQAARPAWAPATQPFAPQPPAGAFSAMPPGVMPPGMQPPFPIPPAPAPPPPGVAGMPPAPVTAASMPPAPIPQVPPVPPPPVHDDVAAQWQQFHRPMPETAQGANAGAPVLPPAEFTAEQEAIIAMSKARQQADADAAQAQHEAALNALKAHQTADRAEFTAERQATIAMYAAQQQAQLDASNAQQQAVLAQQQAMLANLKTQQEFQQQAFSQNQALQQAQLQATQGATFGMSQAMHNGNKAFLDYLKS